MLVFVPHLVIIGVTCILGAILYLRSKKNRKVFSCKVCGESIETEFLEAKNCTSCGASL